MKNTNSHKNIHINNNDVHFKVDRLKIYYVIN